MGSVRVGGAQLPVTYRGNVLSRLKPRATRPPICELQVLCPSLCIGRNGAETRITAANVHMHDRGNSDAYAAIIRHLRNGVELEPILELKDFREGTASEGWFQVDVLLLQGD